MGRNQYLWILIIPIWILAYVIFTFILGYSLPNVSDSFLFFSVISIIICLLIVILFTNRYQHMPPWVKEHYSQLDSSQSTYEPLTEQDLLVGWFVAQKRGLRGFLRRLPPNYEEKHPSCNTKQCDQSKNWITR
jgi:hypothetical protein